MRLTGVITLLLLLASAWARAADYELVLHGGGNLKNEKTLAVFDSGGTLKQGDSIVKVTFAEGKSGGVLRVAPVNERNGILMANKGNAFGYAGVIMLQDGKVPSGSPSGSLKPYSPSSTMKAFKGNDKDMTLTEKAARLPWQWIILGLILFFVAAVFFSKSKAEPVPGTPYAGRRGLEEAIRDIRTRLEQIDANQKELVKKPPVLRSFRAQIEGFEQRLKKLEGTSTASQRSILGVASSVTALKGQLAGVGEDLHKADSAVRSNNELVSRLGQELAQNLAALQSQVQEIQSAQNGLLSLPGSVEAVEGKLGALTGQTESVAAGAKVTADRLGALDQDLKKRTAELASGLETAAKNLSAALESLGSLSSTVGAESAKTSAMNETLSNLSKDQQSLLERHESSSGAAAQHLEALKAATAFLAGELGSIKAEQVELASQFGPVLTEVAEVRKQLDAPKPELAQLSEEVRALRDAESNRDAGLRTLQSSIESRMEQLGGQVRSLPAGLTAEDLGLLKTEFDARLKDVASSLKALGEDRSDQAALQSLSDKLEELKKQIQLLQSKQESIVINASSDDSSLVSEQLKELLSAQSALKSLEASVAALGGRLETLPKLEAQLQTLPKLEARLEALKEIELSLQDLPRLEAKLELLPKVEARLADLEKSSAATPAPAVASASPELEATLTKIDQRASSNEEGINRLTELVARLGLETEEARKASLSKMEELVKHVDLKAEEQKQALLNQPAPILPGSALEDLGEILRRNTEETALRKAQAEADNLPITVLEAVRALNHPPVEEPVAEPVAAPELIVEPESPAAPVLHLEESDFEPEEAHEHDPASAALSLQWPCAGGSFEKRWSTHLQKPFPLKKESDMKPLMPIETPDISSPVTNVIYAAGQVVYSHGEMLRGFWPGRESRSVALGVQLPADAWRLMANGNHIYCASEEKVEVVGLPHWSNGATFSGRYTNQLAMGRHWAGVRAEGGSLAVEVRDAMGNLVGKPHPLQAGSDEKTFMVANGEDLFVGAESGFLFRLSLTGSQPVTEVDGKMTHLVYNREELVILSERGSSSCISLFNREGKLIRSGSIPSASPDLNVVLMADRLYYVGKKGELNTVNLKKTNLAASRPLNGIRRVRRMIGFMNGAHASLLLATADGSGQAGRVLLFDPKSGEETRLCSVNQPGLEMIAADGRAVIATSASFQNIIRIFEPFAIAKEQQKAA